MSAVLFSGIAGVAIAAGAFLLASSNLSSLIRVLAVSAWVLLGVFAAIRLLHARLFVRCLRFSGDGTVRIGLQRGDWIAGSWREESLVLRHIAWIRLRPEGGPAFDLLLLRATQKTDAWRRFLVISRYVGRVS